MQRPGKVFAIKRIHAHAPGMHFHGVRCGDRGQHTAVAVFKREKDARAFVALATMGEDVEARARDEKARRDVPTTWGGQLGALLLQRPKLKPLENRLEVCEVDWELLTRRCAVNSLTLCLYGRDQNGGPEMTLAEGAEEGVDGHLCVKIIAPGTIPEDDLIFYLENCSRYLS
jgi:hypothetical protein